MENVYKKLVESLSKMTPQQKQEEWEDLKHLNDFGPTIDEFFSMYDIDNMPVQFSSENVLIGYSEYAEDEFYKAA